MRWDVGRLDTPRGWGTPEKYQIIQNFVSMVTQRLTRDMLSLHIATALTRLNLLQQFCWSAG